MSGGHCVQPRPSHPGKQGPIPGVPDLMGLLEEKGLVPPGGLEEVGRIVVQSYSTDPGCLCFRNLGGRTCMETFPSRCMGINMVRCAHGCGGSADFAGGCAAIACACRREYCRICGGSGSQRTRHAEPPSLSVRTIPRKRTLLCGREDSDEMLGGSSYPQEW